MSPVFIKGKFMKTIKYNGKRVNVIFKTHSGMNTRAHYKDKTYNNMSCNVYNIEGSSDIALVLSISGSELYSNVTVISEDKYQSIAYLYDPYHGGKYHSALLEACGAENLLKVQ